jgi:hypothetical protein
MLPQAFRMLESHPFDDQVAIVDLIWRLHQLRPDHVLETVVSEQLVNGDLAGRINAMNSFGTLWRLTGKDGRPAQGVVVI